MVYFTADMHFGHRAIINMQSRPFESVEEMNRVLLQNFNSVVHKDDTVYILGDICHHMKIEDADELIRKMNGKKYLIIGNHDKKYDPRLFEDIRDFMKVSVDGCNFALMLGDISCMVTYMPEWNTTKRIVQRVSGDMM